MLLDVFRHKKGTGAEMEPLKPTVGEILASPKTLTYQLLATAPTIPGYGYDDIIEVSAPGARAGGAARARPWCSTTSTGGTDQGPRHRGGKLHDDDFVVVYPPAELRRRSSSSDGCKRRSSHRARRGRRPRPARRPSRPIPRSMSARRFTVMPRLEALASARASASAPTRTSSGTRPTLVAHDGRGDRVAQTGIRQRLYTELDLDHLALLAAQRALAKARRQPEEIGAVLFCPAPARR